VPIFLAARSTGAGGHPRRFESPRGVTGGLSRPPCSLTAVASIGPACLRRFQCDGAPTGRRERRRARRPAFGAAQSPERRRVLILMSPDLEGRHDGDQLSRCSAPWTIARLGGPVDAFALPFADSALSDDKPRRLCCCNPSSLRRFRPFEHSGSLDRSALGHAAGAC
jgi:hypothetical protein